MLFQLYLLTYTIKCNSNQIEPTDIPIFVPPSYMTKSGDPKCQNSPACPDQYSSSCGERCWSSNTKIVTYEYTFRGVMFQVYGTNATNHGSYNVYLDNELQGTVDQRGNRVQYQCQFTSKLFPYGNHTIKIEGNKVIFEISAIAFWPSIKAKRINISDFSTRSGIWKSEGDKIGGLREYTSNGNNVKNISIQCSKFWIYGSKDSSHKSGQVKFGTLQATFSETSNSRKDFELIYESPELQLSFNEFILSSQEVKLINFIYILNDFTPISADIPISVPNEGIIKSGSTCTQNNCPNADTSTPCGTICTTNNANAYFQYNFTGVRFQVFGNYNTNLGSYRILLDGNLLATINQYFAYEVNYALQYTSDIFPYGNHQIKIEVVTSPVAFYKFTYCLSLKAKRINITDFSSTGSWTSESNKLGGMRKYSNYADSTLTKVIQCSKFWLIGIFDPSHVTTEIEFGNLRGTCNETTSQRIEAAVVYESPQLEFESHTLKLISKGIVLFNCVYFF